MNLRTRVVIAAIATAVVVLMGGGVQAGVTLAQRQAANRAVQVQHPVVASPVPVATHSLIGRISAVEGDRLLVRDRQRHLREVRLVGATVIRSSGRRVDRRALLPGDRVAVVGQPSPDRALVARLISVSHAPTPTPRPIPTR